MAPEAIELPAGDYWAVGLYTHRVCFGRMRYSLLYAIMSDLSGNECRVFCTCVLKFHRFEDIFNLSLKI